MNNKPLSVAKEEFKSSLIELVNGSNLPPCLVEEVMGGIFMEVKTLAKNQYDKDFKEWQDSHVEKVEGEVVDET